MSDTPARLLVGSFAGLAATGPMTAVMDALYRAAPPDDGRPLPPREITMQAADAVGVEDDLSEDEKTGLTMLAHYSYGAGAGAVYGVLAPHLPRNPTATGIGFGLAVWAVSYVGWLPALRILPPPHREEAERTGIMIAAHVVWGAALGVLTGLLLRGEDER
jgi:uncharacterized membrane protein YagU involved in acid resistance